MGKEGGENEIGRDEEAGTGEGETLQGGTRNMREGK